MSKDMAQLLLYFCQTRSLTETADVKLKNLPMIET